MQCLLAEPNVQNTRSVIIASQQSSPQGKDPQHIRRELLDSNLYACLVQSPHKMSNIAINEQAMCCLILNRN